MKKMIITTLIIVGSLTTTMNASQTTYRPLPKTPMQERLNQRTDLFSQENQRRYQDMQRQQQEEQMMRNRMPEPMMKSNPVDLNQRVNLYRVQYTSPLKRKQMGQPLVNVNQKPVVGPGEMQIQPYLGDENEMIEDEPTSDLYNSQATPDWLMKTRRGDESILYQSR